VLGYDPWRGEKANEYLISGQIILSMPGPCMRAGQAVCLAVSTYADLRCGNIKRYVIVFIS